MRRSWPLVLLSAALLLGACVTSETIGEDLVVDWKVDGATSAASCATYGIDHWVVRAQGPSPDTTSVPCGTWDSGAAFTNNRALVAGSYTITVAAEDSNNALLATKSFSLSLPAARANGVPETLTLVFEAADFSAAPVCNNDGTCDDTAGETPANCPNDCTASGCNNDGTCEPNQGETPQNCPNDCQICNNDGTCEPNEGETFANCPNDCPVCNNDGTCDTNVGETPQNCPNDCDICNNDGTCDDADGEDELNCPNDCPNPCNNDGFCQPNAGENAQNCPNDC